MRKDERENKQEICDRLLEALRATRAAGVDEWNSIIELRYIKEENGNEWVIPIFKDGTGEPNEYFPHGYYGVCVTCDSGVAVIMDVVKQFVRRVW